MTYESREQRTQRNRQLRRDRLAAARMLGTHTAQEWEALKASFDGKCVRCGTDEYRVEKDHIRPIYQGGSDSISNIQPVCARCNCSKGPESFDWAEYRRLFGFDELPTMEVEL